MKVLVVGASGATGRLLVDQLLNRGHTVRAVIRDREGFLQGRTDSEEDLDLREASLLEYSDREMEALVEDCGAVASCLGHRLSFRGLYGPPRRLVTDAVRRLCGALAKRAPDSPVRFVLMNTTGNRHHGVDRPVSMAERGVLFLLRHLLPPHADNEEAAEWLRSQIGSSDSRVEWVVVRPDGLIDEEVVTDYEIVEAPSRSAIFDSGKTSRIHVADFMARLATEGDLWERWRGRMPVIYNREGGSDSLGT